MTGTAQAQQVVLHENMLQIIDAVNDVQVVRLDSGGDLYLGGDGWYGDIIANRSDEGAVLYFNASNADLVLGGASSGTAQAGDLFLRDDNGLTTTIRLEGQFAHIILGNATTTEDGDITILDNDGTTSFHMDGASGNISNQLAGNGVVKAWAEINSSGTVNRCYRCNTSTLQTQKLGTGIYEVDFTFSTDISFRPRSALLDTHTVGSVIGMIGLADRATDASSVYVRTYNSSGAAADQPFTIVIY